MQYIGHMGQNISNRNNNRNETSQANRGNVVKYKVRKMAIIVIKKSMLLSNVIDGDHQNSCLFTNKVHFPSPLWVLIGVLAIFGE